MIRFLDSVDHYATVDITEKWTQFYSMGQGALAGTGSLPPTVGAITGRRDTQSLRFRCAWDTTADPEGDIDVFDAMALGLTTPSSGNLFVAGFAFRATGNLTFARLHQPSTLNGENISLINDALATVNRSYISMCRVDGSTHIGLSIKTNGELEVWRGNGALTSDAAPDSLGSSNGLALQMENYFYIEMRVELHATLGTVQIWVDGDLWIDLSGINTLGKANGGAVLVDSWDEWVIGAYRSTELNGPVNNASGYWDYDDLYLVDNDSSDTLNTPVDLLGDTRIDYLVPIQDVVRGWTPLTGVQHYEMVDEIPPDDDLSYNYTDTVNAVDTFTLEAAPVAGANLTAVAPIFSRKRETGGNSKTQPVWRVGGTNYTKDPIGDTGTYTFRQGIWTLNPATVGVISGAAFNASSVGYKKQA